ncbi:MAG: MBL fold metallo-hydrolase [Pseudomonadales bacterium]|nr:MBL fold metallo-hydrolase [Pseudomonadales bacterium]
MTTWKIGDIKITRVLDVMENWKPTMLIPEATPQNLEPLYPWLKPHFINPDDTMPLSIHTFVIEDAHSKIVVDTCIGNDKNRSMPSWNQRQGDFLQQLKDIGAPREAIDYVLCTHLHVDHVGWNTMRQDNQWVATFSNAKYLFSKEEWAFWEHEEDPFEKETKADSIIPVIESGQVEWVDMDHQVTDSVRLIPTPGHTPGHVSVLIESQGATAVITGDLFHHPLQFARPHWKDIADVDGPLAEKSRIEFMQQFQTPTLVLGTHFAHPTAGTIVKDGDSFRFDVE